MSNYYSYRDIGAVLAEQLMQIDGWEVFGYHGDESDIMSDYWCSASWLSGIATKNGYTLVFNKSYPGKEEILKRYNYEKLVEDAAVKAKIEKLERMTVANGASPAEEQSAIQAINKLIDRSKIETTEQYTVIGVIPAHMANPPRCQWHIEKDGQYIDKGTGLLQLVQAVDYFRYEGFKKEMDEYMRDPESFIAGKADWECERLSQQAKAIKSFKKLINRIDTDCGGLLGDGDGTVLKEVVKTETKSVCVAKETETGEIKEGQCFIIKGNFTYGISKGMVYRINDVHQCFGETMVRGVKLNGKLTKECNGTANQANHFRASETKFLKWIAEGTIAWCDIVEEQQDFQVKKVMKVKEKVDKMSVF